MDDGNTKEDETRQRAFHLWEEAGSPDGRNEEFWHKAKEEINNGNIVLEKVKPVKAPLENNI